MGRSIASGSSGASRGTVTEAYVKPDGAIPADGSAKLKADYPALAAQVGDGDMVYDLSSIRHVNSGGLFNASNGSSGAYCDLQTDGTKFVYTNGTVVFVSTDAIGWKPVAIVPKLSAGSYADKLKYKSGVWFLYSAAGIENYGYMTSTDGITWSVVRTPFSFQDMTYDGTNYMFVNTSLSFYGTTVSNAAANQVALAGSCRYVEKIGTNFVAWGNSATSVYITSTGSSWANQAIGAYTIGNHYSVANGILFISRVVDGTSRPWFVYSSNGTTWAASTATNASSATAPARSFVIWDGTTYSFGARSTTAGLGGIYTFTSPSGSVNFYTCGNDGYQSHYNGGHTCFKAGTYAFVSDYMGESIYVTTTAPSANWTARAGYTQGTAYPFLPNIRCVSLAEKGALTLGGAVAAIDTYPGATSSWVTVPFIEETGGYFYPYKVSGGSGYWTVGYSTNSPTNLRLTLSPDGNAGMSVYNSAATYYVHRYNRANRTYANTSVAVPATNFTAVFPSVSGFVCVSGAASGQIRIVGLDGTVLSPVGISLGVSSVGNNPGYNPQTGFIAVSISDGTLYRWAYTYNGINWTQTSAPLTIGDTATGSFSQQAVHTFTLLHDGSSFIAFTGTTCYRGATPTRMIRDYTATAQTYEGPCILLDKNRVICGAGVSAAAGGLIDLRGGNVELNQEANSGAIGQVSVYSYNFGTFISASPTGGPNVTQHNCINLLETPLNTHFRVPAIPATSAAKQQFITV